MAMTKEDVGKLYRETYEKVTSSGEQWRSFLDTASNVYRYDFAKQLMIYAQRPDATACADFSIWTDKMNRRIKYGSKGIAVYDDVTGRQSYLFDISDTKPTENSIPLYNWDLDYAHQKAALQRLSFVMGMAVDEKLGFAGNVIYMLQQYAKERYQELEDDYEKEGQKLGETEDEAERERNRQILLVASSAGYAVLKRCGMSRELLDEKFNFDTVPETSKEQMLAIGDLSAHIADQLLQEVRTAIREYDREHFYEEFEELADFIEENREMLLAQDAAIINIHDKSHDYELILRDDGIFAARTNVPQGAALIPFSEISADKKLDFIMHSGKYKECINAVKHELEERTRENEHSENGIQNGQQGNVIAGDGRGRTEADRGSDTIRNDEIGVYAGVQENTAQPDAAGDVLNGASSGHTGTGGGAYGTADKEDDGAGKRNRGTESSKSAPLGTENEQHNAEGGGNGNHTTDRELGQNDIQIYQETTITCEWSEHEAFEDGKTYSVGEFDALMKKADSEWLAKRAEGLEKYGSYEALCNAEDEPLRAYSGYAKVKFTVNLPDGDSITERQDIGDGDGGVIDFLRQYPHYSRIADALELQKNQELEETFLPQAQYYVRPAETGSGTYELKVVYVDGSEEMDYGEFAELTEVTAGHTLYRGSYDMCMNYLDKLHSGEITEEQIQEEVSEAEKWVNNVIQKRNLEIEKIAQEIAQEAAAAGMTVEEYAAHGYEPYSAPEEMPDNAQKEDYTSDEKSFAEQVDDVFAGRANRYDDLKVCDTPQILLDIGCEQLPMFYTQRHLRDAVKRKGYRGESIHHHGLDKEQIKKLPELLRNPVMVYDSLTRNDSIVVVTSELDKDNMPIVVSIKPNGEGRYKLDTIKSNFITSVHGRNNFENQIDNALKQNKLLYANKQKSQELFSVLGLQLSEGLNNLDFDIIIRQSRNIINTKPENSSNNFVPPPQNFVIAEAAGLGAGTSKEKFRKNMEAIHTLKKIEEESRAATLEEQEILFQYVGWGGLSDAFDEDKTTWAEEYRELKELLSEEEYRNARASTTDAFYTAPEIAGCMYEALQNMGFSGGNILEPSMGIGNFFGSMPETMEKQSRLYGVELDSISGRIATLLYPKADITISGFEKTNFSNDFFDVVIGNVPFGETRVYDRDYKNQNFLIHDYFMAKSIDKVRTGGVVAVITSKGSMDKVNENARRYIHERAEFLGAVRLPNTAFKANAGTEATADILFFKKREAPDYSDAEWLHTVTKPDGMVINSYFNSHPEMVLGTMEMTSGRFGMVSTCLPNEDKPLKDQLRAALANINAQIAPPELMTEYDDDKEVNPTGIKTIPADPDVRNFSYVLKDGTLYFRENSVMRTLNSRESRGKGAERIKGLLRLRNTTTELLNMQLDQTVTDEQLAVKRMELGSQYDEFTKKYGIINSRANKTAFQNDSSYNLLCSLEKLDDDGNMESKADIFTKRTISIRKEVSHVESSIDALAVSLADVGRVDIDKMARLTDRSENEVIDDLYGVIFKNPATQKWETQEEYLSGDIREKLAIAEQAVWTDAVYRMNVDALRKAVPPDLSAEEIDARLGSTWIDPEYIKDFMVEVLNAPERNFESGVMDVNFSEYGAAWSIRGKQFTWGNVKVREVFGVKDVIDAYQLLEMSLNLKEAKIYKTVSEGDKEKRILDHDKTILAQQKQTELKEAFKEWLWKDYDRRETLVRKYNDMFNSTVPRHYDGTHLKFEGSNPSISLLQHQKNAVARILYGGNTLLAHCVGAGKTYTMIAGAMEKKRLGLCHKSLITVPNHLTEQWGSDFLELYPNAKILVATKKDFEPANRKKFCSRIATGDYDAVIIGHSQFEKIPLSVEKQQQMIQQQMDDITTAIDDAKKSGGDRLSIKQLEKTRKSLEKNLEELNDVQKDDVVTFEQLGVDSLFVDESHMFKNLYVYTKMSNVAGVQTTESKKATDMYNKCMYMDELTGGRGITFATGTPIANTIAELYTNMRYLQSSLLKKTKLGYFDAWASTFGETVSALEIKPEGNGFRTKTRFAKFFNLPELVKMWKEAADIQTKEMLPDLMAKLPQVEQHNIVLKPSEEQKMIVAGLAERADAVRNRQVQPDEDNMLKITNDGRKLALDQRLINPLLPDDENSKINACVKQAVQIWKDTAGDKSTQVIFCDLSTPKARSGTKNSVSETEEKFSVYDDIKKKLIENGVPPEEIAFIHDAATETQKAELFGKVNKGKVRIILGSTEKMGAGTNIQRKLVALHHIDVPWRPADLEQQEGRIIRQGNENSKVHIYRYVKEDTFDGYSWQTIENKNRFITQLMTDKSPVRRADDVDETVLDNATLKGLCVSDKRIKEKMDLDIDVQKLELLRGSYIAQMHQFEKDIKVTLPENIANTQKRIDGLEKDMAVFHSNKSMLGDDGFQIVVKGTGYTDKKEGAEAFLKALKESIKIGADKNIGEYMGFKILAEFEPHTQTIYANMEGACVHKVEMGHDAGGCILRMNNKLNAIVSDIDRSKALLETYKKSLEEAKAAVLKPFARDEELKLKKARLIELNARLNNDTADKLTFYVAENAECDSSGEFKDNIATIGEAKEIYDKMPNSEGKGIGFKFKNMKYILANERCIDVDSIYRIEEFKGVPAIQKAIKDAMKLFPDAKCIAGEKAMHELNRKLEEQK